MARPKDMQNVKLEGVRLCFKNFEGRAEKYNPPGRRVFNVILDPETAEKMSNDGWHVKVLQPKTPEMDPLPYISVSVSYKIKAPKVTMVCGKQHVKLDETNIDQLDHAEIIDCDVELSPNESFMNGTRYIRAYLNTMWVTIEEDPFAYKYMSDRDDENTVPW